MVRTSHGIVIDRGELIEASFEASIEVNAMLDRPLKPSPAIGCRPETGRANSTR